MLLAASAEDVLFLVRGARVSAFAAGGAGWGERRPEAPRALLALADETGPLLCLAAGPRLELLRFGRQLRLLGRQSLRLPMPPQEAEAAPLLVAVPGKRVLFAGCGSRFVRLGLDDAAVVELPVAVSAAGVRDAVSLRGELRPVLLRPLLLEDGRLCLLVLFEGECVVAPCWFPLSRSRSASATGLAVLWLCEAADRELRLLWELPLPHRASNLTLAAPSPRSLLCFFGGAAHRVLVGGLGQPSPLNVGVVGAEVSPGKEEALVSLADGRLGLVRLAGDVIALAPLESMSGVLVFSGGPLPYARELHRVGDELVLGLHPDLGTQPVFIQGRNFNAARLTAIARVRLAVSLDGGGVEGVCLGSDGRVDVLSRFAVGARLSDVAELPVDSSDGCLRGARVFVVWCAAGGLAVLLSSAYGGSALVTVHSKAAQGDEQSKSLDAEPTIMLAAINRYVYRATARFLQIFSADMRRARTIPVKDLVLCEDEAVLAAGADDTLILCSHRELFVISVADEPTLISRHPLPSAMSLSASRVSPSATVLSIMFWDGRHSLMVHDRRSDEMLDCLASTASCDEAPSDHCVVRAGGGESFECRVVLARSHSLSILNLRLPGDPAGAVVDAKESIYFELCTRLVACEDGSFLALARNLLVAFACGEGRRWTATPLLTDDGWGPGTSLACCRCGDDMMLAWIGDWSLKLASLPRQEVAWEQAVVSSRHLSRRVRWLQPLRVQGTDCLLVYTEVDATFTLALFHLGSWSTSCEWEVPMAAVAGCLGPVPPPPLSRRDRGLSFFSVILGAENGSASELVHYSVVMSGGASFQVSPVASLRLDGGVQLSISLNERSICTLSSNQAVVCGWADCDDGGEGAVSLAQICVVAEDFSVR